MVKTIQYISSPPIRFWNPYKRVESLDMFSNSKLYMEEEKVKLVYKCIKNNRVGLFVKVGITTEQPKV